jgi:nucleoside-diphosphate-sugar epimerase
MITGGTGLIGSNVCRLLIERGVPVRALVRPSPAVEPLAALGVELVPGDITNPDDVAAAAKGASAIINSAALLGGSSQDMQAQEATNHMGSVYCYDVAAQNGQRVIELTTTTFLKHVDPLTEMPGVLDEQEAGDDPYTVTKGRAYRDGLRRVHERGEDIVFVVPGGTFGPSPVIERALGATSFNRIVRAAVRGRVTDYVAYPVPWVRAEDVANVVVASIDHGQPGVSYLAFGAEDAQSTATFLNAACEAAGVPNRVRDVTVDPSDEEQVARYGSTLVSLAQRQWPTPWFDNTRTRDELDYRPVSLRQAMVETVAWLREHGHIT